jgi:transposase
MKKLPDLTKLTHAEKDALILELYAQVQQVESLKDLVEKLIKRVAELEGQLAKNSRNSGKPPSSDGLSKPSKTRSSRESSGLKPGGQKGHKGHTLEFSETPDKVVDHPVEVCNVCGMSLIDLEQTKLARRQVFDIPEPAKQIVTEHHLFKIMCPRCQSHNRSDIWSEVQQPVQYGVQLRSAIIYWNQYQLIPVNRIKQWVNDYYQIKLSTGSIQNFIRRFAVKVAATVDQIKEDLKSSDVCCFDESGFRVAGSLHWMHTATSKEGTWFGIHKKRGSEAMNEQGILPAYKGVAVHDGWKPYRSYECSHGLCNAHHLRELKFIEESTQQIWSMNMRHLLLEALKEKELAEDNLLQPIQLEDYNRRYLAILEMGEAMNPPAPPNGKQGRAKQSDAVNLLRRLREYKDDVLRFLYEAEVPFTNNQAEQAIRMPKLKQKISGSLRSIKGAQDFCTIRSYIATTRQHGKDLMQSIISAWAFS